MKMWKIESNSTMLRIESEKSVTRGVLKSAAKTMRRITIQLNRISKYYHDWRERAEISCLAKVWKSHGARGI